MSNEARQYVELLSRLNPTVSAFIGNGVEDGESTLTPAEQDAAESRKKTQCKTCRGRGRVKEPAVEFTAPARWALCPACQGSKKMTVGVAKQTRRSGVPETLAVEDLASLCAGMDPRHYRAAVTHITHSSVRRFELERDIAQHIVKPASSRWKCSPDLKAVRVLGVSRVAAWNVMLNDRTYLPSERGMELMCVERDSWTRVWQPRVEEATYEARQWVSAAGDYMARQAGLQRREIESMAA